VLIFVIVIHGVFCLGRSCVGDKQTTDAFQLSNVMLD